MKGTWNTREIVRVFNGIGALVVFGVIFGAYGFQFILLEPPCPLCLLIRLGMIATGFGLALNALYGPRPLHYGFALLGSIFGASVALRQVLLHVVPGTGSYGDPVFGFHLYTWAFVVFMTMIIAIAVVLFFPAQFEVPSKRAAAKIPPFVKKFAVFVVAVGMFLCAANFITTLLECGAGACPDNPTKVI